MTPICHNMGSKVSPIDPLKGEKIAEAVFKIEFPPSRFSKYVKGQTKVIVSFNRNNLYC